MAAAGILSARFLGPSSKGLVTGVLTWGQLLSWGSVAGLSTATAVRVASGDHDRETCVRRALGNAVAFSVVVGGVITVIALLTLPRALSHLGPDASTLCLFTMAMIPIWILSNLALMVQLSLGRRGIYNLAQIANPVILTVLMLILLVTVGLTPGRMVACTLIGGLASGLIGMWHLPWRSARPHVASLRHDLAFGSKLHIGSVFRLANFRLDYLVMSAALPATQLGLYSAANSMMFPLSAVSIATATLLTPKIARLGSASDDPRSVRQEQARVIRREAIRYTGLSLAVGLLIVAIGPLVIAFALGSSYQDSIGLMWILTPGYVVLTFNTIVAGGAAGMRRPWIAAAAEATAVVATLVLLPLLLPVFDAKGAAITSTVAYLASAIAAAAGLARLRNRGVDPVEPLDPARVADEVTFASGAPVQEV